MNRITDRGIVIASMYALIAIMLVSMVREAW